MQHVGFKDFYDKGIEALAREDLKLAKDWLQKAQDAESDHWEVSAALGETFRRLGGKENLLQAKILLQRAEDLFATSRSAEYPGEAKLEPMITFFLAQLWRDLGDARKGYQLLKTMVQEMILKAPSSRPYNFEWWPPKIFDEAEELYAIPLLDEAFCKLENLLVTLVFAKAEKVGE